MRERVRRNAWPHGTALIKIQAKAKRKSGRREGGSVGRTRGKFPLISVIQWQTCRESLRGGHTQAVVGRGAYPRASERAHAPGILDLT